MRKAFTLIELLIVITVIAILGAGISLSAIGILNTADADAVINNMQQIKTAAFMWYKNNLSRIRLDSSGKAMITTGTNEQEFKNFIKDHKSEILKYLNNNASIILRYAGESPNNTGDYTIIAVTTTQTVNKTKIYTSKWYVARNCGSIDWTTKTYGEEAPDLKIKAKIAAKAETYNLLGKTNIENDKFSSGFFDDTRDKFACMPILELKQ